jgi:Asp-tRNA(Asn)/Glu-tRNA(Gln) amidotransferase A subunit family amidase
MTPLAFGTQTAGSIVRPAAYCGVVGYKPSFGRLTRAGVKSLGESLDTMGGFGSTVDDVALLVGALSGDDAMFDLAGDHAPRIGFFESHVWEQALPETRAAMAQAQDVLGRAGARVEAVAVPESCRAMTQMHIDVMAFEAARALSFEFRTHPEMLSPGLAKMLAEGTAMPYAHYRQLKDQARKAFRDVEAIFQNYDILLTPSAAGEAPLASVGTGDPMFCRQWSLLGLPCVHLPFATGPNGLPVGLQAVGAFNADVETLRAARWVHQRLI